MSKFGWSYPPGAANDPNAPWNQVDPPCDVCKRPADDCICDECPECGATGDPQCYMELSPHGAENHNMELRIAQHISRAEARIAELEQQLSDERLALSYFQDLDNRERNQGYE
jgi:hypothetical protein